MSQPLIKNPDLNTEQKAVLFEKATERPYSGKLLLEKREGGYHCANCDLLLFRSTDKYDSGSGWPSFTSVIHGAVKLAEDRSHGMTRTEVVCQKCGSHLGHLFDDGPEETGGARYCINSAALTFNRKINQ